MSLGPWFFLLRQHVPDCGHDQAEVHCDSCARYRQAKPGDPRWAGPFHTVRAASTWARVIGYRLTTCEKCLPRGGGMPRASGADTPARKKPPSPARSSRA